MRFGITEMPKAAVALLNGSRTERRRIPLPDVG
jgi:hypothetical protein